MKEFEFEPGEHLVRQDRKHWLLFVAELLPYAIMAVIPFAIPKLLMIAPPLAHYSSFFTYQTLLTRAVLGVWLLVVWTSAWGAFTRYFMSAWVLTNTRIVNIEQHHYFHREVSSLFLNRVQDVTTEVEGVVSSLLNIGNITVQSAGAVDEFHMKGIPKPEQMRDIILKYVSSKPTNTGV